MAGILNKKTRFIDLVITQEGKRQIAEGLLRAEYASATDMHAFYEKNQTAEETSDRIYFQVAERKSNSLVLEKDDSGKIIQNDIGGLTIVGSDNTNNQLFVQTEQPSGKIKDSGTSIRRTTFLLATGSQFTSLSKELSKKTLKHFTNNRFIATQNSINPKQFNISKSKIDFKITNSVPFNLGPSEEIINVNAADSFLTDKKMAHLPNFKFLNPVNEDGTQYGQYEDVRNLSAETFSDIIENLGLGSFNDINFEESDNVDTKKNTSGDLRIYNRIDLGDVQNYNTKEYEQIKFTNTSFDNNLLIQIFENNHNNNTFTKLDVIEAGMFLYPDDPNGKFEKQIYYAGKIYYDDAKTPTFVNLFTLIFD